MSYKSVSNFNYKNEILRKLIHLFDSVIPLSLFYISRENLLFILTPITIIFIILDFARHHISYLGKIYSTFFNIVTREIEQKRNNVTGASYYLLGCLIVVYFFTSFFVSTIIILYMFMNNLSPFEYIYISLLITLVELFSFHRINDNLTIPVFAALALNYIV